jgi:ubiquinol-cytochrome c reductase cytochrome c1 subunit
MSVTLKNILIIFVSLLITNFTSSVFSAGGSVRLDPFPTKKMNNMASLQNGAKLFVNYCLGCHSISQVRYSRLQDLGLNEIQIKKNLLLTDNSTLSKIIVSSMKKDDAKVWFGKVPPDLSLTARSRSSHDGTGADWIYTYLRSYYKDSEQPTGWNNTVYPGVGMPNVLWELQGINKINFIEKESQGKKSMIFDKFTSLEPGELTKPEFDDNIADLTAFLVWVSDPSGQYRRKLGVWVLLFLGIFAFIAWRLNASYWKDIH